MENAKSLAKGQATQQALSKMPDKKQLIQNIKDKTGDFDRKDQVIKTLGQTPDNKEQLTATLQDQQQKVKGLDQQKLLSAVGEKAPEFAQKEQLMQALAASQDANGLLQKANQLKDKAMKCLNPVERQRMLQEAYDKEVQANGQSAWARRMQSGVWQGGFGGAGIGGGVGMGLGAVLGTVIGGVVSLPTTALGGLVGAGVGGIGGPFIKLDQKKAKQVAEREKAKGKSDEEVAEAVRKQAAVEDSGDGGVEEGSAEMGDVETEPPATSSASISQPEQGAAVRNLERQHSNGKTAQLGNRPASAGSADKPRKKPRKLEVRSGKKPAAGGGTSDKENQGAQQG